MVLHFESVFDGVPESSAARNSMSLHREHAILSLEHCSGYSTVLELRLRLIRGHDEILHTSLHVYRLLNERPKAER